MPQSAYILGFVIPLAAVLALTWLQLFAAPNVLGTPGFVVLAVGWVLILSIGDACNIRRWNDLGSSAALYRLLRRGLVILPLLAFMLQFLVPAHLAMAGDMAALAFLMGMEFGGVSLQPAPLALLAITTLAGLANVIYLAVMPGQRGSNPYGPDPLGDPLVAVGASPAVSVKSGEDDPVQRALAEYNRQRKAPPAVQTAPRTAVPQARAARPGAFGKRRT